MVMRVAKVAICIPCTGTVRVETLTSLIALTSYFLKTKVKGYEVNAYNVYTTCGSMLVQMRHDLVRKALRDECTHVFFVDSDMKFPKTLLNDLLARRKEIVAANYTTKRLPAEAIAHGVDGKRLSSKGKSGVEKAQVAPLGLALIETGVFKQLTPPFFSMEWIPDLKVYCGEDVFFLQCAKAYLGLDCWIDHSASREVKHIGSMAYSQD